MPRKGEGRLRSTSRDSGSHRHPADYQAPIRRHPLADDVAGRVDVVPHLREVVFPLAGIVRPVGTFIPPL